MTAEYENDQFTEDEINATYKVLEAMRECDLFDNRQVEEINNVHCWTQHFEEFLHAQGVLPEKVKA